MLGSAEQAITMPVGSGGSSSTPCVSSCQRMSTVNISGQCCVCNGAVKKFARHPAVANVYLCQ